MHWISIEGSERCALEPMHTGDGQTFTDGGQTCGYGWFVLDGVFGKIQGVEGGVDVKIQVYG